MIKIFSTIRKNYFDNTVELSKLSKTFFLWAIGLVLVYVSNIYLTRLVGLAVYGKYTVFISWVSLMSTLVTFGWDGYLIQKIPQLKRGINGKINGAGILYKAIGTFIVLYLLLIFFVVFIINKKKEMSFFLQSDEVLLFLGLVFLFAIIALAKSFLRVFSIIAKVQWVEDILKPLILFVAILVYYNYGLNLSVLALYYLNFFVFGVVAGWLVFFVFKTCKSNFAIDGNSAAVADKWVNKCFYFMCIFLGYSIFSRMELLFLGYFDKNEAAAKYQILLRISDLVIIPDFLFNYFLPQKFSHHFAKNENAEAKKLFQNSFKTIFLLQLLCFAGVSAIGYFYLQSFGIASPYMYMLLLMLASAPIFYSVFGSSNLVLKTSGNERYSFYALLIVLTAELLANLFFIKQYGLTAAIIISWVSIFVYTLLLSFFVCKKLNFYNTVTGFLFNVRKNDS